MTIFITFIYAIIMVVYIAATFYAAEESLTYFREWRSGVGDRISNLIGVVMYGIGALIFLAIAIFFGWRAYAG